ncbi:MAG: translation initiation factor IF-2 [Planctomycetia bacterium]|nr:translation initiation factor IF-2 [Planctomycetia bacterium]
MQKEKTRVYVLARELNIESKDLLDMCRQAGMDVKNQLSSLEPEQRVQIEALLKKGPKAAPAPARAAPAVTALPTNLDNRVRTLPPVRRTTASPVAPAPSVPTDKPQPAPVEDAPPAPAATAAPVAPAPVVQAPAPPAPAPIHHPEPVPETKPTVSAPAALAPAPEAAPPPPRPLEPSKPVETPKVVEPVPTRPIAPPPPRAPEQPARLPDVSASGRVPSLSGRVPSLGQPRPPSDQGNRPRPVPRPTARPTVARPLIAVPPQPKKAMGSRPLTPTPQQPIAQRPIARPTEALAPGKLTQQELHKVATQVVNQVPVAPGAVPDVDDESEEGDDKKKGGGKRPGSVVGRDARHARRNQAQQQRRADAEKRVPKVGLIDDDDGARRGPRRIRAKLDKGPKQRVGNVPIEVPITVRSLSEAIGKKAVELLFKLREHGGPANATINSTIDPLLAEVLAHDYGINVEIKKAQDAEAQVLAERSTADKPEELTPRAPIVTIMGHVDHGKTTLLDKIRQQYGVQSNVVATEAGGITQVIRAWRVEKDGKPITFLDTPGHEAFTKMRARGANVTDIAVIVVAADDGVMPQTEEAINHAKAAGVSMVVCINKIDLPNANLNKTRQMLYGAGVLPDNMGGDVPFIEVSAAKGTGIDELLENLALLAEVKELKANPNKPATGTCLEANLNEGEGVQATMLVREGTLRRGDVILCGSSFGRVRQLYDDHGRPIQEAGPSWPVRLTGLDEVPNADDPFLVLPDLAVAREIAEKRKVKVQEAAMLPRSTMSLEKLSSIKVAELKVILKADFRGSIEAIKKELDKLTHDEVRLKVLHAAIGGITESDVQLALTSPEDSIIVGFNSVPDDRARTLAEERGIQIRQYNIIYNLTDDIRQALEGKLKPEEKVVHLGRAVVRKTFKVGRVGTVAGCYVTQGVIERSAKVRIIRGGLVVYPPPDRTASLESLRRVKDDVREVKEGFECGIKIANYDDIKVDDVIEAYRVEQVQRTLEV